MKLLLDENIPVSYAERLKKKGNDVTHIKKTNESMKDSEIYKKAIKEKRFIITKDSDYHVYGDMKNYGIIKISGFVEEELLKMIYLLGLYKIDRDKYPGIIYIMRNSYFYKVIPKFSKKGKKKRPQKLKDDYFKEFTILSRLNKEVYN